MAAEVDKLLRRLGQLKTERGVFEAHWQEVRDVLLPVVKSFTGQDVKGGKAHVDILDSTPENALERLAAALDGMLTNPATEWFALRLYDPRERPDYAGARWLGRAAEVLLTIFSSPRSGFPACKHELYLDTAGFQGEFLSPLIEGTFGIAWRAGWLDPPPASLAGRELRIEYLSPMARAQRFSEVTAISRTLELSLPLMQQDPSLADVLDQDAMIRRIADVTGVPAELLRDPAVVERMRAARQEQTQQQSMAQMAIQGAGPMAKLLEAQKAGPLPAPEASAA